MDNIYCFIFRFYGKHSVYIKIHYISRYLIQNLWWLHYLVKFRPCFPQLTIMKDKLHRYEAEPLDLANILTSIKQIILFLQLTRHPRAKTYCLVFVLIKTRKLYKRYFAKVFFSPLIDKINLNKEVIAVYHCVLHIMQTCMMYLLFWMIYLKKLI